MQEPTGDAAVAAALASSVYDRALPHDVVIMGEVGLGGEIRPVSQTERRLAEAANLGLRRAYVAERGVPKRPPREMQVIGVRTVRDLFDRLFA
jgi:DNA repair protein RadA/Sms